MMTIDIVENKTKNKTTNPKYSNKHWKTISEIAQLTGLLMSTADYSGVDGTRQELGVAVESILMGEKQFPGNELISSIIPKGRSKEDRLKILKKQQDKLIKRANITNLTELEEFQNMVFGAYAEVLHNINNIETGIVVEEFGYWILNIAEEVAVSSIEGSFLMANDDPFSDEERNIFNKINKVFQTI